MLKTPIFIVVQMQKWMPPVERAWKTVQENGIVCFVCMCGSRDIGIWISWKVAENAESAVFNDFQMPISREPHMQTKQTIPFSWTVFHALSTGGIHFCIWTTIKIGVFSIWGVWLENIRKVGKKGSTFHFQKFYPWFSFPTLNFDLEKHG